MITLLSLGDFPLLTKGIHLGIDLPEHSGQVSVVHPWFGYWSEGDDNYKPRAPYGNSTAF